MRQEMKELFIAIGGIAFLTFIMWYSCSLTMSMLHEQVHQEIFKDYGIESRIEYKGFLWLEAATITDGESFKKCNDACLTQQNFNEAVAYNLYPFLQAFWLAFFGLMIFLYAFYNFGGNNER